MKLKLTSLLMVFILCLSLNGCGQSEARKVLAIPDKILINDDGNFKELDKTNSQFNKIVELANNRFYCKLSVTKDHIDDDIMQSFVYNDGLGIEFIYNNEQSIPKDWNGSNEIKYYKLYFQLTSKRYGNMEDSVVNIFQYGDKEHFIDSSRGTLNDPEELVTGVKNLKY